LWSGPPTDPSGTGANSYIVKYCAKSTDFLRQKMLNWNFLQSLVTSRRYEMFVVLASSFTTQFHCNSIHQMLQLPTFPPILKLGS
jgi:RNase P/RNase MRP subunit p30